MRKQLKRALDELGQPLVTAGELRIHNRKSMLRTITQGFELTKMGLPFMLDRAFRDLEMDIAIGYISSEFATLLASTARRAAGVQQTEGDPF